MIFSSFIRFGRSYLFVFRLTDKDMQFHADREEVEYAFRLGKIYYQGSIYSPPGGIASGGEGVGALPHDFARAKFYFLKIARHVWPPQPLNSPKRNIHLTKKEGVDENTLVTASSAAAYLGRMYLRGEGVKQDAKIAKIWLERGSEFNDKECHNGLGIIWRDGLVDNKVDEKIANEYFLAAASQDLAEAQVNLGKYHYSMCFTWAFLSSRNLTVGQDRGEYPFAIKYFEAAIRHGSPFEAFYYIASIHARRAMDPQSTPSLSVGSCGVAVSFYKLVAERGSWRTDLVGEAERLWSSGGEAEKRAAKLRWWMAAEQGLEVAQNNLAYVLDQRKRTC
jgi:SEL1 protein